MKKNLARILAITFSFSALGPLWPVQGAGGVSAPQEAFSLSKGADSQVPGKISLDLKGMDVVEVIQMLATKGNLSVVLSDEVKGRVTIFLKSVNIMDAFEIILTANKLAYDKRGGIIYVMAQREYEASYGEVYSDKKEVKIFQLKYAKATEVSKALNQMKTRVGKIIVDEGSNTIVVIDSPGTLAQITAAVTNIDLPTETKVFELKYAKAADLKSKVTETLTKGIGTMQIDERTNKIAVKDLPKAMSDITTLVNAFDTKPPQVLIEAKIVQITLTDKYKLGVDWQTVLKKAVTGFKTINIRGDFAPTAKDALSPGSQITIGTTGVSDWTAMIQALKEVGDANLLSSPRITVINNQEAKIMVGSSTPYATNTVTQSSVLNTTATNLTFLDIGVKLFVTPTISKDGFVTMKIRPEVSSKSGDYTYGSPATTVPIVATTQAETVVTVKDGTTIIIGGLIKDDRSSTVDKIPYLGDIPLVGNAFRKDIKEVAKQELVVFLTPHIVTGEHDYLDNPKYAPIGEERFTMKDNIPVFEHRDRELADPDYFKEDKSQGAPLKTRDDYYNAVKSAIAQKAHFPSRAEGNIKVTFTLSSNGEIVGGPHVVKSSNVLLNGMATKAVKAAGPFPAFPPSMRNEEECFNVDIST